MISIRQSGRGGEFARRQCRGVLLGAEKLIARARSVRITTHQSDLGIRLLLHSGKEKKDGFSSMRWRLRASSSRVATRLQRPLQLPQLYSPELHPCQIQGSPLEVCGVFRCCKDCSRQGQASLQCDLGASHIHQLYKERRCVGCLSAVRKVGLVIRLVNRRPQQAFRLGL